MHTREPPVGVGAAAADLNALLLLLLLCKLFFIFITNINDDIINLNINFRQLSSSSDAGVSQCSMQEGKFSKSKFIRNFTLGSKKQAATKIILITNSSSSSHVTPCPSSLFSPPYHCPHLLFANVQGLKPQTPLQTSNAIQRFVRGENSALVSSSFVTCAAADGYVATDPAFKQCLAQVTCDV